MKKVILTIASLVLGAFIMSAQDMEKITETFNSGAAALDNGDKAAALTSFKSALEGAQEAGEAGAEIVSQCKNIIPQVILSMAKDCAKNADFDAALAKLEEAKAAATEYEHAEVLEDAEKLVGQFLAAKGGNLLNAKDYAGAAVVYKQITDADPTNGTALLRLGMALAGSGNADAAVEAFKAAAANGQEAAANKQLGTLALKGASAALKAKDYATALKKAIEASEFQPTNATAFKIAGNAAAQQKNYKGAVTYFQKYLDLSPKAADAAQIKANIEAFKKL